MTETFEQRVVRIADEVTLGENFHLILNTDRRSDEGRLFYQVSCYRKDIVTGEMGWGYGGKAYLSEYATDSELVQTIFGLYKSYWEHEARETFQWRGRLVFGPHIDVRALWEVAERTDARQ